jgi:MYXO-CTERM domain-containing protein
MRTLIALALAATAGTAMAQPTFLATQGSTLLRYTDGSGTVDSFTLSDPIIGLTVNPSGQIIGSSPGNQPTPGFYSLDNPFGTPSVSFLGASGDARGYTSLTYAQGELYGFFDGGQQLFNIDDNTYTGTQVGFIGVNNVTFGGSAYDEATDTFFAMGYNLNTFEVFVYEVENYSTSPSGTLIGNTGILGDGMSLEFFDGVLYAAIQNRTTGAFELGTIDTATGAFSLEQVLASSFSPSGDPTSLVVIPAPGTFAMLGLGGLIATRRRR